MCDFNQTVVGPERERTQPVSGESTPTQIGRYRIEKVLGKGGFGIVYLAHDGQLLRLFAIKVSHRKLVDRPENAEDYLTEASTVANLGYPNILLDKRCKPFVGNIGLALREQEVDEGPRNAGTPV